MVRKVVIHKPGSWSELKLEEHPVQPLQGALQGGKPGGNVRIRVEAIGVNYADVCVRMGVYSSAKKYVGWPITPGFEVAGIVTEVGPDVTRYQEGDAVMAVTRFGGYTDELVVPEDLVFARPAGFEDPVAAAGFPTVHLTAWYGLCHQGRAEAGETVLVHSAAGGVGGALCALAKSLGCRVVGVVGRPEKVAVAKARGADAVIDKSSEDLWARAEALAPGRPGEDGGGYDVVLDANGVGTLKQSYEHLAPEGRLIIYGFHTMLPKRSGRPNLAALGWHYLRTPRFSPLELTARNVTVAGFNLSYLFDRRPRLLAAAERMSELASAGVLTPPRSTTYPLAEVAEAHRALESGKTVGKLVLLPG